MALVKCKECGNQVSTKAKICPKCGATPPKRTSFLTWSVLVLILLIVYGSWQQESNLTPEQRTAKAERIQSDNSTSEVISEYEKNKEQVLKETAWIGKGKNAVLSKLKDPDSATFKDTYFFQGKDNAPMTCGQVNSKNSFGGFVGFQRFVSAGSTELTFLETEVADFEAVWSRYCSN